MGSGQEAKNVAGEMKKGGKERNLPHFLLGMDIKLRISKKQDEYDGRTCDLEW